ncbi:ABC transporter, partial [Bdellovibrionota bacterium FG-2]
SQFATNNYSRFGGNLDLLLNSVSWVMEDESLISIRAKEDEAGKVELSQKQGTVIFLLTVIIIPLLVAAGGIAIWAWRRRM